MIDEGYIKFNHEWIKAEPFPCELIDEINLWRNKMYELGLIGMYDNGIGYGNISQRVFHNEFLISGSATGGKPKLNELGYTCVESYDFKQNFLVCRGPIIASSESLTHAAIYEQSPDIKAVIHVHSLSAWKNLLGKVPTTKADVPYGTPEMAGEIERLFKETDVANQKILAMAGHEEGIVTFGSTFEEANEGIALLLKA
ncbi:MAG: class II aldolase/adducin family protein [Bacteroidota bacterium]